ncbi:MAG: HEAT repeat domain-containing protein [Polyangiaceae bacterium]|nr:HEAT repeat domain-containing protein [Polyangiaceae bacterium]
MGLFDRFKGGTAKSAPSAKWADRVGKKAQTYDRQEAIEALSEMGTADAAGVLLKRFTFHIDPSITDQEEKDAAFRGVLRAGSDALEPVRTFVTKAESIAWPIKIAKELLPEQEFVEELLRWLSRWDTEYAKFVDPKVQILAELEEHRHPSMREAVEPFLHDVNESARFHAVSTLLAQDDPEGTPALINLLVDEESVRVRTRIVEGLSARGWAVPADRREAVRKTLTQPFSLDAAGRVAKRN